MEVIKFDAKAETEKIVNEMPKESANAEEIVKQHNASITPDNSIKAPGLIRDKNGKLRKKGTGLWRQVKRAITRQPENLDKTQKEGVAPDVAQSLDKIAGIAKQPEVMQGAVAADLYFMACGWFIGEKAAPIAAYNEKQNLTNLFDKYFKANNMPDLPPGVALSLGIAGYWAVRLQDAETLARLSWIKRIFKK